MRKKKLPSLEVCLFGFEALGFGFEELGFGFEVECVLGGTKERFVKPKRSPMKALKSWVSCRFEFVGVGESPRRWDSTLEIFLIVFWGLDILFFLKGIWSLFFR